MRLAFEACVCVCVGGGGGGSGKKKHANAIRCNKSGVGTTFKLSSSNVLNLDKAQILSSGEDQVKRSYFTKNIVFLGRGGMV